MGWKEEARRTITGDKEELKSFPGYWVRPRKYSVETLDKIRDLEKKQQGEFNRRAIAKVAKKMGAKGDAEKLKNLTPADIMEELSDDEFEALYDLTEKKTGLGADIIQAKISGGIAEHNFEGTPTEKLAKDILEYADIAAEMVEIADRYNRPLARRPSETSEPSPDGSTKADGSTQEETTSPTEGTPGT